MTEPKPQPKKVDPRGLRPGEFGDTATTLIPEPKPKGQPDRRDVLRDKFEREIPADFVR